MMNPRLLLSCGLTGNEIPRKAFGEIAEGFGFFRLPADGGETHLWQHARRGGTRMQVGRQERKRARLAAALFSVTVAESQSLRF
jgi:hypothetical protein